MKELSIEEKVRRYDEDDRIRKALIRFHKSTIDVDEIKCEDIIAWLEKQRKIVDYYEDRLDECACKYFNKGYKHALEKQGAQIDIVNKEYWRGYREGKQEILDKYAEIEKQSEQKPDDKVESKFKVGDWVVSPNGVYWHIDAIQGGRYEVTAGTGQRADWPLDTNIYRLWTIQDAKDGDVLVASDGSIFLFKGTIDCACKHYIALTTDDAVKFNEGLEHYWETSIAVHPATKEQRDLMFQKMKEAGYEWDAEKKELKKIEHNPWSEEDETMTTNIIIMLKEGASLHFNKKDITKTVDWLKSIKEKIYLQAE